MFDDETYFAYRLLSLIDEASKKSIIFSPASLLTGLAMFYVGCDGETATEIEQIIGKGKSRIEIIDEFSCSLSHYKQLYINMKETVKVKFANKIFISSSFKLISTFCETINIKFDGGFQQLDFTDNKTAVLEMNSFVKKETNGLIENIIDTNDIDFNTTAVLVNAVYFKAPWDLLFEQTQMAKFKSNPVRTVKMMSREVPESLCWNYVGNEKWTALGIPYEKYRAWIYFVLPSDNYSLKELLLNDLNFRQWTKRECSPFIHVTIPFIDVEYEINMQEKLEKLGMKTAFTDSCNVTNMTTSPMILEKVFHKSTITINEKGTEASAASSSFIDLRSARTPTHSFVADRPFLYFITTVKEPLLEVKPRDEDYYYGDAEDNFIDISECTTEPFSLLFVGTFC